MNQALTWERLIDRKNLFFVCKYVDEPSDLEQTRYCEDSRFCIIKGKLWGGRCLVNQIKNAPDAPTTRKPLYIGRLVLEGGSQ